MFNQSTQSSPAPGIQLFPRYDHPTSVEFWWMHDNHTFAILPAKSLKEVVELARPLMTTSPCGMLCQPMLQSELKSSTGQRGCRRVGINVNAPSMFEIPDEELRTVEWNARLAMWEAEARKHPDLLGLLPAEQAADRPADVETPVKTLRDYQLAAVRTVLPTSRNLVYMSLGLCGEAGEFVGKVKKIIRDSEGQVSQEQVAALVDELGDVLWYAAALCEVMGVGLDEVAQRNLDKLASRARRGTLQGSGDTR